VNTNATPRSIRVVANGLPQHVLEWAPPSHDAVVVLVHGFMDAAATFDLIAPQLAGARLRVLAADMRGFGDGPRVPDGAYYHFPDYFADLAAILDHPEIGLATSSERPIYLVGHSMGGTIATLLAGTFPERFTKLALLEGVGPPDNAFDMAPVRARTWLEQIRAPQKSRPTLSLADAEKRLSKNHPGVEASVIQSRVRHLVRDVGGGNVEWKFDPLHKTISPMPFYANAYIAFAKRFTSPVLALSGGTNGFHVPDEDERLAAFAKLTRITIDGAGHMMHWTRPADVAESLIAFWRADSTSR
jgi:pimeloyl-ACP methyl ester carboxylesterase